MRKRLWALITAIILFVSIPLTAYAAAPRALMISPQLSFNGTTASCSLTVTANSVNDEIEAVIKLWSGSTCLKTWTAEGNGYLFFCEEYNATKNKEYTLTATVTINGVEETTASVSKTCK